MRVTGLKFGQSICIRQDYSFFNLPVAKQVLENICTIFQFPRDEDLDSKKHEDNKNMKLPRQIMLVLLPVSSLYSHFFLSGRPPSTAASPQEGQDQQDFTFQGGHQSLFPPTIRYNKGPSPFYRTTYLFLLVGAQLVLVTWQLGLQFNLYLAKGALCDMDRPLNWKQSIVTLLDRWCQIGAPMDLDKR